MFNLLFDEDIYAKMMIQIDPSYIHFTYVLKEKFSWGESLAKCRKVFAPFGGVNFGHGDYADYANQKETLMKSSETLIGC